MSTYLGDNLLAGVATNTIKNSAQLLEARWFDHILNNQEWLRADTFSWQDGTVYSEAYNHLEADISGKTLRSETVGSTTVQFYLADDGHKICPASQESNVTSIFNATGVAWYYIVDTTNTRFKLPRTKYGFTGLRDSVGTYIPESLPNITGQFGTGVATSATGIQNGIIRGGSGAFYVNGSLVTRSYATSQSTTSSTYNTEAKFDASRSSSIYQDNAPVQQRATQMYLYFYVGQFSQSATEQTAGITTETLNQKLDLDAGNATSITKETIVGWGMPNYNAGVSRSSGTEYMANTDGWLEFFTRCYNNENKTTLTINGVTRNVCFAGDSQRISSNYCIIPIPKNTVYKVVLARNVAEEYINFYPCSN